jgi:hypothetical protein
MLGNWRVATTAKFRGDGATDHPHHRHLAPRLPRRLHGDPHVLPERGQKFHQPPHGEVPRAIAHERRDMRLLDAEHFASLRLRQPARLDDLVDLQLQQVASSPD